MARNPAWRVINLQGNHRLRPPIVASIDVEEAAKNDKEEEHRGFSGDRYRRL